MIRTAQQYLSELRQAHPGVTIHPEHLNVDCRCGIPAGYRVVGDHEHIPRDAYGYVPVEYAPALLEWEHHYTDFSSPIDGIHTTVGDGFRRMGWITRKENE